MTLSVRELKIFMLPSVLFMVMVAIIAYNARVISRQAEVSLSLKTVQESLDKNRETLSKIEKIEEKKEEYLKYSRISTWIPFFTNPLEAELFVGKRIDRFLKDTEGTNKKLIWKVIELSPGAKEGMVEITARFPSYEMVLQFLKKIEEDPPVFIPQNMEIRKEGPGLEISMRLVFRFRLKDESL